MLLAKPNFISQVASGNFLIFGPKNIGEPNTAGSNILCRPLPKAPPT